MGVEQTLAKLPSYSKELGLDLKKDADRFKWFLAAILFAKRISAAIAKKTFHRFQEEGLTTPREILAAGWDQLVEVLDSGGYVRYDFSTASNLLRIMEDLQTKYGSLEKLHTMASEPKDLERRLQEFKGIGPVGVNIFLRELRGIWEKAQPLPSKMAIAVAKRIGVSNVEAFESELVRLNLEYCKKRKCQECVVRKYCKEKKS